MITHTHIIITLNIIIYICIYIFIDYIIYIYIYFYFKDHDWGQLTGMKLPDPSVVDEAKNLLQVMPMRQSVPPRWQVAAWLDGRHGFEFRVRVPSLLETK